MSEPVAKVLFRVGSDEQNADVETLWATPLGRDLYRLDNSPFYAYGVSWRDVIHAPVDPREGMPTFASVVEKSGHRTVRVRFDPPVAAGNSSDVLLQGLVALGGSYEGANPGYIASDVPAAVELEQVTRYLVEHDAEWEHADPTYESIHGNEA